LTNIRSSTRQYGSRQKNRPNTRKGNIVIRNILSISAVAFGIASANAALAADDWYRPTGWVPPQAQGDDFYSRGTVGVAPQSQAE
jgi:hypothetical protein